MTLKELRQTIEEYEKKKELLETIDNIYREIDNYTDILNTVKIMKTKSTDGLSPSEIVTWRRAEDDLGYEITTLTLSKEDVEKIMILLIDSKRAELQKIFSENDISL